MQDGLRPGLWYTIRRRQGPGIRVLAGAFLWRGPDAVLTKIDAIRGGKRA